MICNTGSSLIIDKEMAKESKTKLKELQEKDKKYQKRMTQKNRRLEISSGHVWFLKKKTKLAPSDHCGETQCVAGKNRKHCMDPIAELKKRAPLERLWKKGFWGLPPQPLPSHLAGSASFPAYLLARSLYCNLIRKKKRNNG